MTQHEDGNIAQGFGEWRPLTSEGVAEAPDAPAAVQLATAPDDVTGKPRLVQYAKGKSAMVFYFYAQRSAREALRRVFADELDEAGARGQGPLVYRVLTGGDEARAHIERLLADFEERFGDAPVLHV